MTWICEHTQQSTLSAYIAHNCRINHTELMILEHIEELGYMDRVTTSQTQYPFNTDTLHRICYNSSCLQAKTQRSHTSSYKSFATWLRYPFPFTADTSYVIHTAIDNIHSISKNHSAVYEALMVQKISRSTRTIRNTPLRQLLHKGESSAR